MLAMEFKTLEFLQSFQDFVQEGIEFLKTNGNIGREDPRSESTVELSPETVEKLKDILRDVEETRSNLLGGNNLVYSVGE